MKYLVIVSFDDYEIISKPFYFTMIVTNYGYNYLYMVEYLEICVYI